MNRDGLAAQRFSSREEMRTLTRFKFFCPSGRCHRERGAPIPLATAL